MRYTEERIRELARISHIALSEEEIVSMRGELKGLYALAEVLEKSFAASLEESFEGGNGLNDLREDVCREGLSAEDLLRTALREDGYFHVPRAVEAEA